MPGTADDGPGLSPGGDYWVFAYGSLMWNPGFPCRALVPAILHGYHRRFCLYSHHHRGTPEQPGLVLGLAPGGACRGLALQVAAAEAAAVRRYLNEREQVTNTYRDVFLPVRLLGPPPRKVRAHCFVADRAHPQYVADLPLATAARLILEGKGQRGPCYEYFMNTLRHLEEMGIRDRYLQDLHGEVEKHRRAAGGL